MSTGRAPLVFTPVSGRRRGRIAFAAWLAALLAVVTWVLAAGIGSPPPEGRSAVAPGAGATQSGGSASTPARSSRPTPTTPMELLAGPPPSGTVWLRSGNGARSLDLWSGETGPSVGTGDWRDRILHLPRGQFVCVCSDVTAIDGGERVTVSLANIDAGMVSAESELVTVEGLRDDRVRADEQLWPVATSASLSPDGSLLAVGISVRRPPRWERSVLLVDVPTREVVQRLELEPVPAEERVEAWAPRIQFAHDGLQALIGLTVVRANAISDERHFVAWIHGGFLPLEAVTGFGTKSAAADARCIDAWPELLGHDTVFALCRGRNGTDEFLRSVAIDTGRMSDLDLQPVLEGSFPRRLVDRTRGILYLWDPFSHRAARVHIASAKLDSATVIDTPTAAVPALDRLVRTFSAWIAPAALAKIMLEPGLALSPDGQTLYVVAMSGDKIIELGRATTIHVLDATSLRVRATWTVAPDVVSIAIAPNGTDVIVGMLGEAPEGVAPDASVTLLDAQTGQPRARYQDLGAEWPMLVEPSALNE